MRQWRGKEGKATKAFVPPRIELGEALQFAWDEQGMVAGGIYYEQRGSRLELCAGRATVDLVNLLEREKA